MCVSSEIQLLYDFAASCRVSGNYANLNANADVITTIEDV